MKIFIILLCLCFTTSAVAQDNKLLFHYSRYKEAIYEPGDIVSFRLKGSKQKLTRQITEITNTVVIFEFDTIAPHQISHMYVDKKSRIWFPFRYKYAPYLLAAGVGYFLIDSINSKEIDRSTLIVSGSFLVAGGVSKLIVKDYLKLDGRRKLVILR